MPKKIKQLKNMLLKAGFICKGAKGSHSKWIHTKLTQTVIISGKDGSDAKPYQEKLVSNAIELLGKAEERRS